MKDILVVYWPMKGSVEKNAKRISEKLGSKCHLKAVNKIEIKDLESSDLIILGCSTVGADAWQDAWSGNQWTKLFLKMEEAKPKLDGKKLALFGLGDQILYPEHFVDEMIILSKEFAKYGIDRTGNWPTEAYEHTDSRSIENGSFIGLALDEHNQADLSEERIDKWLKSLGL